MKVFEKAGERNTDETIALVVEAVKARNINHIVAASTRGVSAVKLHKALSDAGLFPGVNLVVVTHNTGFSRPGEQEFDNAVRESLVSRGVHVLTCPLPTRSLNRAIRNKVGFSDVEIVAATLRVLGEGIKVCLEIASMACDAGLVPPDEVIAVAGTGKGYDTAAIIRADSSHRFFDMKVRDILCKPYNF